MPRLPIGQQLKTLGRVAQQAAQQAIAGGVQGWMLAHRAELTEVIQQARVERGAELLRDLCVKVPMLAGLVSLAMTSSPEMAIATIGVYDRELGEQMKLHRDALVKLQEYWRAGAAHQQEETQ